LGGGGGGGGGRGLVDKEEKVCGGFDHISKDVIKGVSERWDALEAIMEDDAAKRGRRFCEIPLPVKKLKVIPEDLACGEKTENGWENSLGRPILKTFRKA